MKRLFLLSFKKIRLMFGGRLWLLPAVLLALSLCFYAASSMSGAEAPDTLRIAVCDECGDEASMLLVSGITSQEGFSALVCASEEEAKEALIRGECEAALTVLPGYSARIAGDSPAELISLESAPGSVSAGLIRETVLGRLLAQRADARARERLARDGFDPDALQAYAEEFTPSSVCTFTEMGGSGGSQADRAVFGQGFAGFAGFAAFALMLVMLTLSRGLAGRAPRLVSERLRTAPRGAALAFASDAAAPLITALAFSALAFAFAREKTLSLASGLLGYSLLLSGVCCLLSSLNAGLRTDVIAPFAALITSLLGGCFADASLSPALALISKFTPQGQLVLAASGAWGFAALLAAEGLLLAAGGAAVRKKRS